MALFYCSQTVGKRCTVDETLLKKSYLNRLEELFVGGLLLLLALGTSFQVFTRYCFGLTFDWLLEMSRYMTILAAFAGASLAVRTGGHFSMEALVHYVPPKAAGIMRIAASLVSAFVMGVIAYYGYEQVDKLARYGMTTPAMGVPMWIPYTPIVIFSGLICLRFVLQGYGQLKAMRKPVPAEA